MNAHYFTWKNASRVVVWIVLVSMAVGVVRAMVSPWLRYVDVVAIDSMLPGNVLEPSDSRCGVSTNPVAEDSVVADRTSVFSQRDFPVSWRSDDVQTDPTWAGKRGAFESVYIRAAESRTNFCAELLAEIVGGELVLSSQPNGVILSRNPTPLPRPDAEAITRLRFSRNGELLAAHFADGSVGFFDTRLLAPICTIPEVRTTGGPEKYALGSVWSADGGQYLAYHDGDIAVVGLNGSVARIGCPWKVSAFGYGLSGDRTARVIAVSAESGETIIYRLHPGHAERVRRFRLGGLSPEATDVAVNASGNAVTATVVENGVTRDLYWDLTRVSQFVY